MVKYKFNDEVAKFLDDLKALGGLQIETLTPIEARKMNLMEMPSPEVKLVVEIGADGPFGPIPIYNYTPLNAPKDKPLPTIVYFHGGGYVAGSPETHHNMLIKLAELSSIQIFAIDYSLSPESNFPKAINEAVSSYNSLLEKGFNNENIFFGGDSAGGNLTLVSTLKLQELNQKLPSKLFLLSPWTDLTGEGRSIKENSKSDPYLSYDNWLNTSLSMQKTVKEWYAPNQDYKNPLISPVFAKYSNYPKTLIQVSDIEILYSDSLDLESKIKDGNNEVTLSVYNNLPHVWQIFGFLPEAKQALKEIAYFLKN